jgi:hypothetical protein
MFLITTNILRIGMSYIPEVKTREEFVQVSRAMGEKGLPTALKAYDLFCNENIKRMDLALSDLPVFVTNVSD